MNAHTMFASGLVVMALFGLGHFGGFVQASVAARRDPGMADLTRDMRAKTTRVMGFEASILDFREYFSLNFSILLWMAAAVGWLASGSIGDFAVGVRPLAGAYALGMLALLATSIRFHVAQGIVTCSVLVLLFGSAWWLA
jgi:hypothetical protein